MRLQQGQAVALWDGQDHCLGEIAVERIEGPLVLGVFTPRPDYVRVEPLFTEFVEAANQQLFHRVDELDALIAQLGLHLKAADGTPLSDIYDVQIAGPNISFRVREQEPINGQTTPSAGTLKRT
jgi:hypothetical protein